MCIRDRPLAGLRFVNAVARHNRPQSARIRCDNGNHCVAVPRRAALNDRSAVYRDSRRACAPAARDQAVDLPGYVFMRDPVEGRSLFPARKR